MLKKLRSLELDFGFCNFGDEELIALARSFKKREVCEISDLNLALNGNCFSSRGLVKVLNALKQQPIQKFYLNLSNNELGEKVTSDVLAEICRFKSLEYLILNIRNIGTSLVNIKKRIEDQKEGCSFKILKINH